MSTSTSATTGKLQDWSLDLDSYLPRDFARDPSKYEEGRAFAYAKNFAPETQEIQQKGRRTRKKRKQQVTTQVGGTGIVLASGWLSDLEWSLSNGLASGGALDPKEVRDDIAFAIDHFECLRMPEHCFTGQCRHSQERVAAMHSQVEPEP